MDYIAVLLLALSVAFSTGRNLLSKSISGAAFGTKKFYLAQTAIFYCGSAALLLFGQASFAELAPLTVVYALIYGVLLVSAQWCYTAALKNGNTAICSTVYSLGFIFPTLSGVIFWGESMTLLNLAGILCVIPAILISGRKPSGTEAGTAGNSYIVPLIAAMASSGGLGIMQKVQQSSPYPEQKAAFVLIAFLFAGTVSLVCALVAKREIAVQNAENLWDRTLLLSGGVGICFGCSNLLNTTLAGMLDSAVFFPLNNISVILVSMILSVVIFREKIGKKEAAVLTLGIAAILLLKG